MSTSTFTRDGLTFAYLDEGAKDAQPVLMIHGFASNKEVNWVNPGWVQTLTQAGYRALAMDNRGHGQSSKPHDPEGYDPANMALDALALLDHLGIKKAHVMGYSMGARISAYIALDHGERVNKLVLGGLGSGMIHGVGDWDPIADALVAEDVASIRHPRGLMFRKFADQTGSDRFALAACIRTSRDELSIEEAQSIFTPTLVGVGTKDDIAGSAQELADILPNAVAFDIEGRDHMLAVGDRTFKAAVLEFLA